MHEVEAKIRVKTDNDRVLSTIRYHNHEKNNKKKRRNGEEMGGQVKIEESGGERGEQLKREGTRCRGRRWRRK